MKTIDVAKDFYRGPSGRYPVDGEYNGERFREEILKPSLEESDKVCVDFTHAKTPGSSFLEEAFGGLVRKGYFTAEALRERLEIHAPKNFLDRLIFKYINEASA
ncbi:STAS-like domain-containing protein [Magnetococcales bacterium HHB-1]